LLDRKWLQEHLLASVFSGSQYLHQTIRSRDQMPRLFLACILSLAFLLRVEFCFAWPSSSARHISLTRLQTFPRSKIKLAAFSGTITLQDPRKQIEFHSIDLTYPGLEQVQC